MQYFKNRHAHDFSSDNGLDTLKIIIFNLLIADQLKCFSVIHQYLRLKPDCITIIQIQGYLALIHNRFALAYDSFHKLLSLKPDYDLYHLLFIVAARASEQIGSAMTSVKQINYCDTLNLITQKVRLEFSNDSEDTYNALVTHHGIATVTEIKAQPLKQRYRQALVFCPVELELSTEHQHCEFKLINFTCNPVKPLKLLNEEPYIFFTLQGAYPESFEPLNTFCDIFDLGSTIIKPHLQIIPGQSHLPACIEGFVMGFAGRKTTPLNDLHEWLQRFSDSQTQPLVWIDLLKQLKPDYNSDIVRLIKLQEGIIGTYNLEVI